ncbi:unnamed protein product, partial [Didymodactylos carnosus]
MDRRSKIFDLEMLEKYSRNGSIFAQRLLEAKTRFLRALQILTNAIIVDDDRDAHFITELSVSVRIEHIVVQMSEHLRDEAKRAVDRVLARCNSKRSELDEDARVCYGILHMNSLESTVEFLTVCTRMYPKSSFFLELRGSLYSFLAKYEQGLVDINTALQLVPNDAKLLYSRAAMLRLCEHVDPNETVAAYNTFLKYAPIDYRKIPEAYYSIASCYFLNSAVEHNVELAEKYYEKGIEAEKHQLPLFLPYGSNHKLMLSQIFHTKSKTSDISVIETETNTQKPKSRLTDPRRIDIIQSHRKCIAEARNITSSMNYLTRTVKPRLHQNSPASLIGLKAITLREMNPMKDHVYQGYVLSVTIFEQSPTVEPSVWLPVEDDNGDLERLFIYNIPPSEGRQLITDTYTYGTKMSILNP